MSSNIISNIMNGTLIHEFVYEGACWVTVHMVLRLLMYFIKYSLELEWLEQIYPFCVVRFINEVDFVINKRTNPAKTPLKSHQPRRHTSGKKMRNKFFLKVTQLYPSKITNRNTSPKKKRRFWCQLAQWQCLHSKHRALGPTDSTK